MDMNANVSPLTPEGKTQKDTQIKTEHRSNHKTDAKHRQTDRLRGHKHNVKK